MAQGRAALVLKENRQDSVEALAQLFIDPRLDTRFVAPATGSSASERLEFILRYVSDFPEVPLGPLTIKIDGRGLNPNLNDGTDDQINHFLTAVVFGYDPSFIDLRVALSSTSPAYSGFPIPSSIVWVYPVREALGLAYDETLECSSIRLIVGHEIRPDPQNVGNALAGFRSQVQAATEDHISLFMQAVEADRRGADIDPYLAEIFLAGRGAEGAYDPFDPDCPGPFCNWGSGNSMADLRLSVKGYRFGQEIQTNIISSRFSAAMWLRQELK